MPITVKMSCKKLRIMIKTAGIASDTFPIRITSQVNILRELEVVSMNVCVP